MEMVLTQLQPEAKAIEGVEPMDRMKAVVAVHEERHGYGYLVEVRVWVPSDLTSLEQIKAAAFEEARRFMREAAGPAG